MGTALKWQVETLRFTLFHSLENKANRESLWERLVGEAPESRTERPAEGVLVEEGSWLDQRLTVSTQSGRVDVVFQSVQKEPTLPNAGFFEAVLPEFRKIFPVDIGVPVTRLAFGVVLLHPEPSHASAYDTLRELLSCVEIKSNTREFMYQINMPVQSNIDKHLELNRICRWNALRMQLLTMPPAPNGKLDLFATRLELDISTSHDANINDQFLLPTLVDEMISKAIEVSEKGDRL